mgnify:CR=1 FL=1
MKFRTSHYRTWLPLLLVVISGFIAYQMYHSSNVKRSWKSDKPNKLRVVKVAPLKQTTVEPKWQAAGTIIPAESVNVVAEVSGIVKSVNNKARPGALLEKGAPLVTIKPTDYLLNLATQNAQLVQAQASFDLEKAEQRLAKEELSYMNEADKSSLEMALVLREPQFKSAEAKLAIAKVNVKKAEVALERTNIKMPFTGTIIKKNTGHGSKVNSNSALFSVVNVDTFWIEVKVPRAFLMILNKQKSVTLSQAELWGEGKTRKARIISTLPELDNRDRQAKVLLAIDDPLNIIAPSNNENHQPVYINDFVTAELSGGEIDNAWTLETHWLQPDNTVWVIDKQKTMQKRDVNILFKEREFIYVSGNFQKGDFAITEKPNVTAIGMKVIPKLAVTSNTGGGDINKFEKFSQPIERKRMKKREHKGNKLNKASLQKGASE